MAVSSFTRPCDSAVSVEMVLDVAEPEADGLADLVVGQKTPGHPCVDGSCGQPQELCHLGVRQVFTVTSVSLDYTSDRSVDGGGRYISIYDIQRAGGRRGSDSLEPADARGKPRGNRYGRGPCATPKHWPPPLSLGIERLDDGQQARPRYEGVHAREELLATCDLLFRTKLGLGETRLMNHTPPSLRNTRLSVSNKTMAHRLNQRFLRRPTLELHTQKSFN